MGALARWNAHCADTGRSGSRFVARPARRGGRGAPLRAAAAIVLVMAVEATFVETALAAPATPARLMAACSEVIQGYDKAAESARRWCTVLVVLSAAVGSLGSACAAFVSKASTRKIAGVAGAIGAVTAALQQTSPEWARLDALRAAAGRHRDAGLKVTEQMEYLPADARLLASQYAAARFVDCAAVTPPATVPPRPSLDGSDARSSRLFESPRSAP